MKLQYLTAVLMTALLVYTVGCGEDPGNEADPEPVDHETTRSAVEANAHGAVTNSSDVFDRLQQDEQVGPLMQQMSAGGEASCGGDTTSPDGDDDSVQPGEDGESTDCVDGEPSEADPEAELEPAIDFLRDHVFIEEHIEDQSEYEITYLIDGSNVCMEEDFADAEAHQECVEQVDQLEVRLEVTSPGPDDIDIAVLIGPDEYNPLDVELHSDLLATEVDLGQVHDSISFAADVVDESVEGLPETMQGRVRAELGHRANHAEVELGILDAIRVSDDKDNIDVRIDRSSPLARFAADANSETLEAGLDLGAVEASFPTGYSEASYDSETGEEDIEEYEYQLDAFLAGATFETTYSLGDDQIDIQGIGLGSRTSTLDVEGERVFEADLNGTFGRTFDLTLLEGANGVEAQFEPAFDLELMFAFQRVVDQVGEVDDWMRDELLGITLDGATKPSIRVGESGSGPEVVDGQLQLTSKNEETVTVRAGECLLDESYDEPTSSDGDSTDDSSGDDTSSSHPFAYFAAGSCQ